ncbi:lipopolysaccharide biosynthesis protein [Soonwooa sp.]|uniref:lipopolysaccharide biosynthesis protein n=1 Tax=Soonwooa sp. TaxID=1938592 RepID=UPI0028AFCAD8|nr:lipopolysaccharide biosynthesis protein [Soonwooa sp.]
MVWTFAEQFGSKLISFGISIILARLLTPTDFGTIALFGIFIGVASALIDGGMGASLIRTKDVTDDDYSTVFYFNIGVAIFAYLVVFFIAPLVSSFYQLPIITDLVRVYALILIINSFVTVQRTHFVKELNFKTAFKIQLPSLIIGGITGIVLAYVGYGVWSLVYSAILQSIIFTLQHWFYSSWRPQWVFNKEKFKYHFSFGYKMTLSGLLDILFQNLYIVLIGKLFSLQQLGYYNRADSLKQLPVSNLSNALNKVTFPLFAKISHNDIKLREVYAKLLKLVIFIIAPTLMYMVVVAMPLIRFLFTDKWLPAVPYFQILSIAGILLPIHSYNLNVLKVKGRSDLFLRLEVIKKILIVSIVLVSINFGIFGLLWGQVVSSILALFVNTYYTGRFLKYSMWDQCRDLIPSIALAGLCGVVSYLVYHYLLIDMYDLLTIIIILLTYFSLYLSLAYLFKFKEINYAKEFLKK